MAKSDFEKIVAQYAEMMATAASIVPECVDLINNYRKNNYDATTKYIKDICMGKYELQYLLGLGGTQMQTVTVGMAAFLCCGSKHDKNFLTTMVTAYSNSPKIIKLHLLQTEIYSLFIDVLKKCAETGAIASLDIQSGKINDETRAFAFAYFLSVAPNKSFEEAVIRTFVESDVRSAIVPPAKKSSRFAYLMHTTVKDRFHDKNLKHKFCVPHSRTDILFCFNRKIIIQIFNVDAFFFYAKQSTYVCNIKLSISNKNSPRVCTISCPCYVLAIIHKCTDFTQQSTVFGL